MDCRIKLHGTVYPYLFCGCKYRDYADFHNYVTQNCIESFFLCITKLEYIDAFQFLTSYIYGQKMLSVTKLFLRNFTNRPVSVNFQKVRQYMPQLKELYLSGFNVNDISDALEGLSILDIQRCVIVQEFDIQRLAPSVVHLSLLNNRFPPILEQWDFTEFSQLYSIELAHLTLDQLPILPLSASKIVVLLLSHCHFGRGHSDENWTHNLASWKIPETVRELVLKKCGITHFPDIPPKVRHLDISGNRATMLPPNLVLCLELEEFFYDHPSIQLQLHEERFLIRFQIRNRSDDYHLDDQNVHNTDIQKSVLKSIQNLMGEQYPQVDFTSTGNQDADAAIQELNAGKEKHVVLLLTYREIFEKVWNRIASVQDASTKASLLERLCEEVLDSKDKCFLGQLSRLINSLCGFFDDIHVEVGISDQIIAKMNAHLKRLGCIDRDLLVRELCEVTASPQIAVDYVDEFIRSL